MHSACPRGTQSLVCTSPLACLARGMTGQQLATYMMDPWPSVKVQYTNSHM